MNLCRNCLILQRLHPCLLSASSSFSTVVSKKNYYEILEVPKDATPQDIKEAFYALSKKNHPDIVGTESDRFLDIREAYDVLKDDTKRQSYDNRIEYDFSSPHFGDEFHRVRRRSYEYKSGDAMQSDFGHSRTSYESIDLSSKYGHFYDPNLEIKMAKRDKRLSIAGVLLTCSIIGINILYVHYLLNKKKNVT